MVIGLLHHCPRHERRSAHTFEGADSAGLFFGTMHDGRIELDHAVSIRQTAVTNAVVEWIELDYIHARDHCVEHVRPGSDHLKCLVYGRDVAAVFEPIAVG